MTQKHKDLKVMQQSLMNLEKNNTHPIVCKYGNRESFFAMFHVNTQIKYTINEHLCFYGKAPKLAELNEVYGKNTAEEWLLYQLADLSEYCGTRDKISPSQLKQLSQIMVINNPTLSVVEIMLFFCKFKNCDYGRFYGTIDPMIICEAMKKFVQYRNNEIYKYECKSADNKEPYIQQEPITYKEYLRRKALRIKANKQ